MSTDTTNAPETAVKGDPIHQAVPLSEWIRGTLRLHFAHRATVTRKKSLAEAQSIHEMLASARSSDRLDWFHSGWIQFANDQVVASEFEADEDLGWPLTAEDRAALKEHPHGILATLRDHWKAKGSEPSYSPFAMWNLHSAALGGLTGNGFATLADYYEGEKGDRRLRAAFDEYTKAQKAQKAQPSPPPPTGRAAASWPMTVPHPKTPLNQVTPPTTPAPSRALTERTATAGPMTPERRKQAASSPTQNGTRLLAFLVPSCFATWARVATHGGSGPSASSTPTTLVARQADAPAHCPLFAPEGGGRGVRRIPTRLSEPSGTIPSRRHSRPTTSHGTGANW